MAGSLEDLSKKFEGFDSVMQQILDKVTGIESWKSKADESMDALRSSMADTAQRLHRLESVPPPPPPPPSGFPQPPPAWVNPFDPNLAPQPASRPSAMPGERPSGHRVDNSNRDVGGGILGSPPPRPVTGMPPPPAHDYFPDTRQYVSKPPPVPKLEFPTFHGDNPRLWKDRCDLYFEVYNVSEALKPRFAALSLKGAAATWLQTVELRGRFPTWEAFHTAVCDRFDRDQYQIHMKQLDNLRQTGSVAEYQTQFESLAHSILLYNPAYDDVYFVTRFLGGLKEEIRAPIALHRPPNLDTASALALLQEEELEACRRKQVFRGENRDFGKSGSRAFTTPDKAKGLSKKEEVKKADSTQSQEKWAALKAFRKANNLCFICGEKWTGRNHKCPDQVPIHMFQELMELFQLDDCSDDEGNSVQDTDEVIMAVKGDSSERVTNKKRKTIRFQGFIGKQQLTILLDSGSVGTFVSESLVSSLGLQCQPCQPLKFTTADGSPMVSDKMIPHMQWFIQGHTFSHDPRILPLQCFDMILGADWLEEHSPTWIHWRKKIMRFPHLGRRIQLKGIREDKVPASPISQRKLKGLFRRKAVSDCVIIQPELASDSVHHDHVFSIAEKEEIPQVVQQLISKYDSLFQEPTQLPPERSCDHSIPLLPGAQPVNVRPYRYSPQQKTEIEQQIATMLKTGIITPSRSSFASPVLLVKKKDGTWRFCVDYRHLNALTVKNKHPLPIVDELLDELSGASWFTKLDFRSGYHQIRVAKGEEFKTAFKTHSGLYEFRVMPFGLTNAPATFQSIMNTIFAPILRKHVLVFMDDILVYSPSLETHLFHLEQVFQIIQEHKFCIKQSKCVFAQPQLEYLGHVISANGVSTEPSKIQAVVDWPVPKSIKALRGFLGLTGYYRRFIKSYSMISRPLTQLLKKGVLFQWTSVAQEAFDLLKQALVQAPVLAIPDFSKQFVVETDASDYGFGAVLMQEGHPVSYLSQVLCDKNKGLSTYEKECMAVLLAVEKWRSYLVGQEFIISTDHRSLLFLTEQRAITKLQHKAVLKLMDLNFKIQYKKGPSNLAADALSRISANNTVHAISVSTSSWMDKIQEGYLDNQADKELLSELSVSSPNGTGFSLCNGLIRYKGRVWVGNNSLAQSHILQSLHHSGIGGHSGIHATYHRVKNLFAWPKMKQSVTAFVQACAICQQAKSEHVKTPGLLQPLPVPEQAWATVSMDFIEGLPKSGKFDTILVVVDKFSKYGHFIPLAHPYTALQIAQLYLDQVYKLHGLPQAIISDRDRVFTSALWQELFRLTDTKLMMSSSYHPQTDGQTERLNQCLETFLRCSVHSCPRQWSKWLSLAEYWYNTSYHSAIGRSPFEVLYGQTPRHFGITKLQECIVPDLESWLKERNLLTQLIQQQLVRAQNRMKHYANSNRSEREFQVGDMVYLKLQPHLQSSIAPRGNNKLIFRFYGPFKVIQKVGAAAYKLDLPGHARIHPVIHVSQLKKHVPPLSEVSTDLSSVCTDPEQLLLPVEVLDRAFTPKAGATAPRVKVRWAHLLDHMATWEDEVDLRRRHPDATAWGQAAF